MNVYLWVDYRAIQKVTSESVPRPGDTVLLAGATYAVKDVQWEVEYGNLVPKVAIAKNP